MKFLFKKTETVYYILIITAIIGVYLTSINYPFLEGWDDQAYITRNPYIALNLHDLLYWISHAPPVGGYTPLTMFTFMIDHSIWKFNSIGYHIQNIIWHIIAVLIIYKIFRYFSIKSSIYFLLCLVFALHPQRIESVVWISERKDVLCGVFYFLSLFIFLKKYNETKVPVIVYITFILGLLSKPMAYSLPFIFIIYDFHKTRKADIRFYIKKYWKLVLILVPYGIVTISTQAYGIVKGDFSLAKRVYIVFYNLIWYLYKTLIPINISPIYARISISESYISVIIGYSALIIMVVFMFIKNRKKTVYITLPIIISYVFSLLPVCGIFLLGVFDHADRFSYIPSVFIWLGVGLIMSDILRKKSSKSKPKSFIAFFIYPLLILYLSLLIFINIRYIDSFSSLYKLNKAVCRLEMPNPIVLQKLGIMEVYNGDYKEALNIADRLVKVARSDSLSLNERDSSLLAAASLRFLCYYFLNEKQRAIDLFEEIKPFYSTTGITERQNYLAILSIAAKCYYSLGDISNAVKICDEIISRCKGSKYIYYYYNGQKALYLGDHEKASNYLKISSKFKPVRPDALEYIESYKNDGMY